MKVVNNNIKLEPKMSHCSFCSNKAGENTTMPLFRTKDGKASICLACLRKSEQLLDMVPKGAIKCNKCGSIDGVVVHYSDLSVSWLFGGLDADREIVYIPMHVPNVWTRDMLPTKACCARKSCKASIPVWLLHYSNYIRPS